MNRAERTSKHAVGVARQRSTAFASGGIPQLQRLIITDAENGAICRAEATCRRTTSVAVERAETSPRCNRPDFERLVVAAREQRRSVCTV